MKEGDKNNLSRMALSGPRSFGDKASDSLAAAGGSWTFIIVFLIFLAAWMLINLYTFRYWDPYPYILLNLNKSDYNTTMCR